MQAQQPMNEEQFRANIVSKYPNHFEHVYRLHALAEQSIQDYGGLSGDHYHGALVLIFPRAYKSFDSVRRLCEVASCEDAAVILRCLLNLMVVTRWISLKPVARARRYFAWYWVEMNREAQQANGGRVPAEWVQDIQRHFWAVKPIFEYTDAKGRLRMARQWYEPEVNSIFEMFKEADLEKQYEEGYRVLSGVEHSDAMAYFTMLSQSERHDNDRKIAVQGDMFVAAYLRNAFQYFGDIFRLCNKTVRLADNDKLEEIIRAGTKFYRSEMQAKGILT